MRSTDKDFRNARWDNLRDWLAFLLAWAFIASAIGFLLAATICHAQSPPLPPGFKAKKLVAPADTASASPASAQNTNTGITGRAPVRATVSIAWDDESLTAPNFSGYDVWYGSNPLAISNELILTNHNWLTTNGEAEIGLSNLSTTATYYVMVSAFGPLGGFDVSGNSQDISFIAPGYILPALTSNGLTISFMTFTNHAYIAQGAKSISGPWTNQATFRNAYGLQTLNEPTGFYRLLIQ